MTSLQWVYAGSDQAERQSRYDAMNFADKVARHAIKTTGELTGLQREALVIRRGELTWGDLANADRPVQVVRVQLGSIFWGVILANLALGIVTLVLLAIDGKLAGF